MAISDEELELQLSEAGNKLLHDPPSSDEELLLFLDKVEGLLSKVEQSPPESILDTLPSFVKALIDDKLITHSDEEIKVIVASCISEITRITAPDAPYEDQQMKDVFRLIVSSFENLHDKSSRSYAKRTSILETVARVRSCVVMLDLECHTLIREMFQNFLKSIREYHPKNVFESMVTIMTLIIEESEDVSPELLSCLLTCVRKDIQEVSPVAQVLVEKVLRNCASTLEPCFGEVLQALGSSLDDYNDVVMSIFRDIGGIGMNHKHAMEAHKVDKPVPLRIDPSSRKPKLRITNMVIQRKEADSPSEKEEHRNPGSQSKSDTASGDNNVKELVVDDEANLESLLVSRKRKGRQLDGSQNSMKKQAKKLRRSKKKQHNVNLDELSGEGRKKVSAKTSSKGEDGENLRAVLATKSINGQAGKQLKKQDQKKKREDSQEAVRGATELSENELGGMSNSEAKDQLHSCTKVSAGDSTDAKSAITLKISRKINDASGVAEERHAKSSSKKGNTSKIIIDGSSVKKQKNKKQLSSEKEATETGVEKSAVKQKKKVATSSLKLLSKSRKEMVQSSETSKANITGKDTPGKKSSDVKGYGMDLVGCKIRVWWPRDHEFYEGVVDSFDPGKKKHKVVYSDGDKEILNLQKEKWELVAEATGSDQGQAHKDGSADGSLELPLKERVKKGMKESSTAEGKKEAISKQVRDASSSKGKATSLKSGQRTGVGKAGKNSKNKSIVPAAMNVRKSDDSPGKSDKSDIVEKAGNLDEPDDDDLLSLRASIKSIKSKGRAGKTKDLKSSSGEDESKIVAKAETMDSDSLENQKGNASNMPEGREEKTDGAKRDEPKEEEPCVPEKAGTESKTGKKRERVA